MAEETIIKTVKDAIAAGSNIIESGEKEIAWVL
jgi:hypothetical protein